MLTNIDNGFLAFGVSAVDISAGVGGTAVLYRKQLAKVIDIVDCDEPRLCAVNIKTCNGPVLFVNVYMPTDARDDNSFDEYVDICMKISSVFVTTNVVYMVIAGDFNCNEGARFYDVYQKFLQDEQLVCVDKLRLNGVFTYVSDDRQRTVFLDRSHCMQSGIAALC